MKKLIVSLLITCFIPFQAFADCDFKTGIKPLPNGNYEYSHDCHIKVGEMKRDLDISLAQNLDLTKALNLKDLALQSANERAELWMNTSYKLQANINTMDKLYQSNKYIYFGLGVVATFAASYAIKQVTH